MSNTKDHSVYIQNILDSITEIEKYLENQDQTSFLENTWDQAAVIRYLEIIGEAANKIPSNVQEKYVEVPWGEIIGLRNVLIHNYADVDLEIVWKVITTELPILKKSLG